MSRRVLSIGSITNQPTSHFNAYKSGSGVGGTSQSVRRALQRRATLNSGTMANPKSGTCTALCNKMAHSYPVSEGSWNWSQNLSEESWLGLSMSGNGNYLVATYADNPSGNLYISDNFGSSWTHITTSGMTLTGSFQTEALATNNQGDIVIASDDTGKIYRSIDYGNTYGTGVTINSGYYKTMSLSNTGQYIVGGQVGSQGSVIYSNDYGASWNTASGTDYTNNWWGTAISGNGKIMIAANATTNAKLSTDFGGTWNDVTSISNLRSICISDDGTKMAGGDNAGNVWISTDTGVSWNPVKPKAGSTNIYYTEITCSNDFNTIAVASLPILSNIFELWISRDAGITWKEETGPTSGWSDTSTLSKLILDNDGKRLGVSMRIGGSSTKDYMWLGTYS